MGGRVGEQRVDVVLAEQPALARRLAGQRVAHALEHRPLQVLERRHREVALGAVDHRVGDQLARRLLQHALAAVRELVARRDARGELDQRVVEEGHARLQAEGHGHVVHALDRVVDQHHRGVQAQRLLHRVVRARGVEARRDEGRARIDAVPLRVHRGEVFVVVAVAEGGEVVRHRVGAAGELRVPVVAAEDLVRALPALHHLAVARHGLGEQVEADAVVAHHGLVHRRHRLGQAGEQFLLGHEDALVHRAELARDDVGVFELVALLAAHIGEADVVGAQLLHPHLGHQTDDEAGIDPAR